MRFVVLVKATQETEAGVLPTREQFEGMGAFNEELAKAGVLLAADGLQPSSKGARLRFSGHEATIIDGPTSLRHAVGDGAMRVLSILTLNPASMKPPTQEPCHARDRTLLLQRAAACGF
jgi:hypothetical protein